MKEIVPLVSVCCLTYNHSKYIRDAINGFLIQKTDFPIEILIHDDASTDGTADIIREYEAKYPDLIFPIYQTENQHFKGNKPGKINRDRAKGKYIAICEGDDFWTDPLKLQKQVDFLESNIDYGLVYTRYKIREEQKLKPDIIFKSTGHSGDVLLDLIRKNFIATLTVCFRKDLLEKIDTDEIYFEKFIMTDYPIWIQMAKISKIYFLDEITSTYRLIGESLSHSKSFERQEKFLLSNLKVQLYYIKKFNLSGIIDIGGVESANYEIILKTCFFLDEYHKAKEYAKKIKRKDLTSKIKLFLTSNKLLFGFFSRLIRSRIYSDVRLLVRSYFCY
jgi:glycosyltransferase involved in cell wall biosynthesis